jgi:putative signal transducing protein
MSDRQNPDELVSVFENIDPTLVSIVHDALESVDIESFIFDASTSQIMNISRLLVPIRLMVYADTADQARECLRELGIEKS